MGSTLQLLEGQSFLDESLVGFVESEPGLSGAVEHFARVEISSNRFLLLHEEPSPT